MRITSIKRGPGAYENPYTAIILVGWINEETGEAGSATRQEIYDFLSKGNQPVYVKNDDGKIMYVVGTETVRGTKYVKTVTDETKPDVLLSLPECL